MSVEWAAQLMAERHIDAIPVTKDDKVIGLFTERDYFNKVLNECHQATRSSMVSEVGTMGPELIVARPEDTVEDCLAVMTTKNLVAMPVVESDGHAMGIVSILDLTRPYMEAQMELSQIAQFSEPAFFPEGFVLPDGDVYDEELGDAEINMQLAMDPAVTEATMMADQEDYELDVRAAEAFCEGSVFPEYTPTEEMLLVETHGKPPSLESFLPDYEREARVAAAHSELLSRMETFSEPSDFPEAAPADEAMYARAA